MWNLGSLLGVIIVIQIMRGFLITFYYENSTDSFNKLWICHLDSYNGSLIHFTHLNMASYLFLIIYVHIFKSVLKTSFFRITMTWVSGWLIMLLIIIVAFIGYVLPWGQIRLWGATVITNLISAVPLVGTVLVTWIWGGYFISNFTIKLFFSIHFIIPFLILCIIIIHLLSLHIKGSSNPVGGDNILIKEEFDILYIWKDIINFVIILIVISRILFQPYMFSDFENFIKASPLVSPIHIQPEWYFLQYYAILRAIPNKLGGILFFILALLILLILPFIKTCFKYKKPRTKLTILIRFYFIIVNMVLIWLGGCPVEYPYIELSSLFIVLYFLYPLMLIILIF